MYMYMYIYIHIYMHIFTYSVLYIDIIGIAYGSILQSRHGELNQDCLAATAGILLQVFTSHGQLVF